MPGLMTADVLQSSRLPLNNASDARPAGTIRPQWFIAGTLALFLGAVLVYVPVMRGGFIWDDNYFTWQQPLNYGDNALRRIWFSKEPFDYWPVTFTVFRYEWEAWGTDPFWYHMQNILLHGIDGVLLWLVLRKIRIRGAWLASMIFTVHPVNAATVAWITEIKNTLSTMFALGAVLAYLAFEEADERERAGAGVIRWIWYGAAVLLFSLGVLTKGALVGLPLLILIRAWWKSSKISVNDVLRAAPFLAIAAGAAYLTIWYQHYSPTRADEGIDPPQNWIQRFEVAGAAIWFYLYKTVWPARLIMIYPHWQMRAKNVLDYLPTLALAGVMGVFWHFRRSWGRPWLVGLACFVILMAPALGFVTMSYMKLSFVADHFQYPAMAVTIAMIVSFLYVQASRNTATIWIGGVLALVVICYLGYRTGERAVIMRGHVPLWRKTIADNPAAYMAYYHLGTELANEGEVLSRMGRQQEAVQNWIEAEQLLARGAQIKDYSELYANLGAVRLYLGKFREAAAASKHALEIKPKDPGSWANLGIALETLGQIEDAKECYRRALSIQPNQPMALANLARLNGTTQPVAPAESPR